MDLGTPTTQQFTSFCWHMACKGKRKGGGECLLSAMAHTEATIIIACKHYALHTIAKTLFNVLKKLLCTKHLCSQLNIAC